MNIIEEIKASFKTGNNLTRLIYINIGVFLALHLLIIFLFLFNKADLSYNVLSWLSVPADTSVLASRPWSVLSYMFLHKDFFHILFNLLWLYWFGKIFLLYMDEKSLLSVYLLGGFSGAFFFIAAYNLFPVLSTSLNGAMAMGAQDFLPKPFQDLDEIMTIEEVARYLSLHELTVRRLAREGEIPAFKVGRQWRVKRRILDRWIERETRRNLDKEKVAEEGEEAEP